MIVTVTMNPAIDKTVDIDTFKHGSLNRIQNIVLDAGGKGINVSKTIKALGGNSVATGFLGGTSGTVIEKVLNEWGIQADFVSVSGETRTNMKVVEQGGIVTELNEPGPEVTAEQVEMLLEKLEAYAEPETLFVLAGSTPKGVDKTIYGEITRRVHAKGALVLLDADGELFVHALEAGPDIVKPNRAELEAYFREYEPLHAEADPVNNTEINGSSVSEERNGGQTDWIEETNIGKVITSEENVWGHLVYRGKKLQTKGIGIVVISMGKMGALFLGKDEQYKCPGLQVEAHSTVGAGDAMVAALAYGWEQKMSLDEMAALGMAASVGAVTTKGTKPPARELVDELLHQVKLEAF